jgi:hypothetical protein
LGLFVDLFDRRFKVICPSVHFRNLYWGLFQELSTSRKKRLAVPGGGTTNLTDVCDPFIRGIIIYALGVMDWRSNSVCRQKVIRVVDAQYQVCFLLNLYHSGYVLHWLLQ